MANVFNIAKRKILDGTVDLDDVAGVGRMAAVLLSTSPATDLSSAQADLATMAAVEGDAAFLVSTATGSGMTTSVNLTTIAFVTGTGANPSYVNCDNIVFSALSTNPASIKGMIIYQYNTTGNLAMDAANIPLAYYDLADTAPNDNDFTVVIDAAGWLQLT
jgi:hypothetical protein